MRVVQYTCAEWLWTALSLRNRPANPASTQGSHRPRPLLRNKYKNAPTRPTIILVELSINNHIVLAIHKNHILQNGTQHKRAQ